MTSSPSSASDTLVIPISKRAREYGYVFWSASEHAAVSRMLEGHEAVDVEFCGSPVGRKNVDRRHRRISVGTRHTARIAETAKSFRLEMKRNGTLSVSAE